MALELLAGPYSITTDGGTAIDTFLNSSGMDAAYIQGVGLFASLSPHGETPEFCSVQLDGTCHRRGWLSKQTPLLLNLRDGGLAVSVLNALYAFDILAARMQDDPFYTAPSGLLTAQVICADRYLRFSAGNVQTSADGVSFATEHVWSGAAPGAGNTVSRGGAPNVVCVSFPLSGQIRFYDVVRKIEVGAARYVGEANQGVWYVPRYDVFVELVSKQLKVLANAVRPASLANPSALTTVQAGRTVQVRTQLLGAQSEPCVGELINWSITSGSGSLTAAQTTTDEDGYAHNTLISPIGGGGDVTVQAMVAF